MRDGRECRLVSHAHLPIDSASGQAQSTGSSMQLAPADVEKKVAERLLYDKGCDSPGSTETKAPSTPRHGSSDSLDLYLDGPLSVQVTVPLSPGLLFHGPKCMDIDEERPLLQAEFLELSDSGELRAVGTLRSTNSEAMQTPVYSGMEDLLIDVRAQHDDEPRLVRLLGARVQKGRIDRIFLDANFSSICCRLCRPGNSDEVHVPLEQAIKEMFELERRRQNAELVKYQKQLCSSMMRHQRSRYLGLDQ